MFGKHILGPDDSGALVRLVQEALNHRRCHTEGRPLRTDGYYGRYTKDAVAMFQKHRGLRATGKLTLSQFDVLMSDLCPTLNPPQQDSESEIRGENSRVSDLLGNLPTTWSSLLTKHGGTFLGAFVVMLIVIVAGGYAITVNWTDEKGVEITPPGSLEQRDEKVKPLN